MQKLLLIGQAPSRWGDPDAPLEGRIGGRIANLAGISTAQYLASTERRNLLNAWIGKAGKGDRWDAVAARQRAEELAPTLAGRTVLLIGKNVAEAFGLGDVPWLTWVDAYGGRVAVMPHLSSIVRWWNSKENTAAAAAFLKEVFE